MKKNIKRFLKKFKKKNTHKFSGKLKNLFNNNKFSMLEVILLLFVTLVFGVMIGYFTTFNSRESSTIVPQSLITEVYEGILNNYYENIDI